MNKEEIEYPIEEELEEFMQLSNNLMQENQQLQERIEKAIEILKLCNSKCAKETIEILKGGSNE